jgi:DNA polymerase-3 subunit delta
MAAKTTKTQKQNELVIVIAGKEQTLVNDKCTEIVDKLLPPEERTTGLWVADADKVTISEVLDDLRTLPFLTKRRVVVLRNATKFLTTKGPTAEDAEEESDSEYKKNGTSESSNREILEKYFDKPCATGVLVMTVTSWPKNTRLAKKLSAIGKLIEVESPKAPELKRLLIAYAQDTYGKHLDYGTADLLVETSGDDITRLKTEIDKLATYAADEKAITAEHVEALVGYNRMYNAFAVIDACLQRKPAEAVERLRKMFAEDKNADYTTVGAFAYHFRNLFTAKKLIQEGYNEYEAAGRARIYYNKESKLAQLRRLTIRQIGDQIKGLAEIDYAIKRGQAQPRIAIEQFVLRMTNL